MKRISFPLLILLVFHSCSGGGDNASTQNVNCDSITAENADHCLRLNHIQVLGTHNSYKRLPHPDLVELLNEELPGWSRDIEYEHKPLKEQLSELGIRQIELDIFADPEGGRYAEPSGASLVGDDRFIHTEEMLQPGFKIIHIQDIDYCHVTSKVLGINFSVLSWHRSL